MDLVIIGTGNTANALARKFISAGHTILQVYGRNSERAAVLASAVQAEAVTNLKDISSRAPFYVIAVSDSAIGEIAKNLNPGSGIVVHTAGSVRLDVLKACTKNCGVLYPLQTLKEDIGLTHAIPFLINAAHKTALQTIELLASSLSETVVTVDDDYRLKMHLAGVVVNNFTNHLLCLASHFCQQNELNFTLLEPLLQQTIQNSAGKGPCSSQTGPAIRNDLRTISAHLALLNDSPQLKTLYQAFTESIRT